MQNQKITQHLTIVVASSLLFSACAKMQDLAFQVNKPEDYIRQETINKYAPLKEYATQNDNSNLKIGVGTNITSYLERGAYYRLLNSNFDEITITSQMNHANIVDEFGDLQLLRVSQVLEETAGSEIAIVGQNLIWHLEQNAKYLNEIIAPELPEEGDEYSWEEKIQNGDLETEDFSSFRHPTSTPANTLVLTNMGEGADGIRRAIKVANPTILENDWQNQFFIVFPQVKVGDTYEFSLQLRSDHDATIATQAHIAPQQYKHWNMAGTMSSTTTWTTYSTTITITPDMADAGAMAFNLGATATNYYFDNISFKQRVPFRGLEKTPEQKREILYAALEEWIGGIVTHSKDQIKVWDVVNQPMSDGADPYALKTGVNRTDLSANEFYWQDYLGIDYGATAFKLARKYGNADDLLFMNDYGLGTHLDKCKGLIEYMAYIESQGAKIDGLGTQLDLDLNADRDMLVESFKLLANSGKLIKIAHLGISMNGYPNLSRNELLEKQAELYSFVINAYNAHTPAPQRYGITLKSAVDNNSNAGSIGLWDANLTRKASYKAVADGLAKKEIHAY